MKILSGLCIGIDLKLSTTQIGAGVLGCEQGFALKFLAFDFRIRIRSPSSLSTIRNEGAVVAHGDVRAHVSLRASLSLRSCFFLPN